MFIIGTRAIYYTVIQLTCIIKS